MTEIVFAGGTFNGDAGDDILRWAMEAGGTYDGGPGTDTACNELGGGTHISVEIIDFSRRCRSGTRHRVHPEGPLRRVFRC